MATKFCRNLIRTAAAVCFVVGSTAQAGGVFYQSDFDPLGFAGSAKWRVDDNCGIGLLANGYYGVNLLAPGGCDVALWTLDVSLWEKGAPTLEGAASDTTLISVPFDNEQSSANPTVVAGIWVQGGELAGVDTFLIGPELIDNTSQTDGTIEANFGVQFTSGHSPLGLLAPWFGGSIPAIGNLPVAGAYLWQEGYTRLTRPLEWVGLCPEHLWATYVCAKEIAEPSSGYAAFIGDRAFYRIPNPDSVVPEPGSLALLGGALVAGWFARRRKTAA